MKIQGEAWGQLEKIKIILYVGKQLKRSTIIKEIKKEGHKNRRYWELKCSCGETFISRDDSIKKNLNIVCQKCKAMTHGMTKTRIYKIYKSMKQRCLDINSPSFEHYGGRGIAVCTEWLQEKTGFLDFYLWSINNGYDEKLTIDRVDVNGNYEPNNCRWATMKEQANNKRDNVKIEIKGTTKTLQEWSDENSLSPTAIKHRQKLGMKDESLISPSGTYKRKPEYKSGVVGVSWMKSRQKWMASCVVDKKKKFLGYYDRVEDAAKTIEDFKKNSGK